MNKTTDTMERKMKDSGIPWIGMIPEEWEVAEAKFLVKINPGSDPKTEGDIPVYGSGSTSFRTCGEYKTGPVVLVGRKGTINIPQYILGKYWNVDTAFDVTPKDYDIRLYYYMAQCFDYEYYQTSTAVPSMTQGDYARMMLPIPSHNEQEAIASWLDEKCGEIDELIEIEQKMIVELEAYRQATITETVTRGLNPEAPMRQTGISWIPEIPEHWEVKSFKEYFSTCKGLSITKADLTENGAPVINYGQIHSKSNKGTGVTKEIIKFVPEFYVETDPKSLVNKGDFIFADTSEDVLGCGNCVYIDTDDKIFAGYHSIIAKTKKYPSKYLAYLFKTNVWRTQIHSQVSGIKVYSVSQALLGTTKIVIPPLSEQQAIADYLDTKCQEIDELIAVKREKIDTLKQYRQSIIFEAVTGKIQIN